jgi:hypothetical protein
MIINPKVLGINQSLAILNKYQKDVVKDLRKDIAEIASPMVTAIRSNIPNSAPIRGFSHNGRTAWPKRAIRIQIKLSTSRSARKQRTATAKLIITNAGVQIADMAGKANKIKTSGLTRAYAKGNTIMRHRINGQGRFMIDALNSTGRGRASRYIYPAVDKYQQRITMEIDKTIEESIINANRELQKKIA